MVFCKHWNKTIKVFVQMYSWFHISIPVAPVLLCIVEQRPSVAPRIFGPDVCWRPPPRAAGSHETHSCARLGRGLWSSRYFVDERHFNLQPKTWKQTLFFFFSFLVIHLKPFFLFLFLLYHLLIGCSLSHYYSSYCRQDVGTSKCTMQYLSCCLKLSLAVKRGDHTTVQPCVITMSYRWSRSQVAFTRDSLFFFVLLPPPCLWFISVVLNSWKGINQKKKKRLNMLRCLEVCL